MMSPADTSKYIIIKYLILSSVPPDLNRLNVDTINV